MLQTHTLPCIIDTVETCVMKAREGPLVPSFRHYNDRHSVGFGSHMHLHGVEEPWSMH